MGRSASRGRRQNVTFRVALSDLRPLANLPPGAHRTPKLWHVAGSMRGIANQDLRVARPPDRPTCLYDRDCGFCRRWVLRRRLATRDAIDFEPYQIAQGRYPEIPITKLERAVHLIRPDGTVASGALAVFEVLAIGASFHPLVAAYKNFWPFALACEWGYAFVAANRIFISRMGRPLRQWRACRHVRRRTRAHR